MRTLLAACRKLAVDYNTLPNVLYVFERETKYMYMLIHAPYIYTCIVVFWHISDIPPLYFLESHLL